MFPSAHPPSLLTSCASAVFLEALGNEVCDTVQEAQEVELSRSKSVVGGYGLLKEVAALLRRAG